MALLDGSPRLPFHVSLGWPKLKFCLLKCVDSMTRTGLHSISSLIRESFICILLVLVGGRKELPEFTVGTNLKLSEKKSWITCILRFRRVTFETHLWVNLVR
jgi:hypothetical protein